MPKVDWKISDAKRLLRAVQKQGLADRPITISKQPDGTLTIGVFPSLFGRIEATWRCRFARHSSLHHRHRLIQTAGPPDQHDYLAACSLGFRSDL